MIKESKLSIRNRFLAYTFFLRNFIRFDRRKFVIFVSIKIRMEFSISLEDGRDGREPS